jgi:hypothetical protein
VSADEIFILLLSAVFFGWIIAVAVHSRRADKGLNRPEPSSASLGAAAHQSQKERSSRQ